MKSRGKRNGNRNVSAMRKARNIKYAVDFAQTYIEKGTDVLEALRIASRLYRVGAAEIREKLTKAPTTRLQMNSRIWGPDELAHHFGFSIHWVYKITKKNASDPPPRCPGLGRLRFDTESKEFQEWIARQTNSSRPIDISSDQNV